MKTNEQRPEATPDRGTMRRHLARRRGAYLLAAVVGGVVVGLGALLDALGWNPLAALINGTTRASGTFGARWSLVVALLAGAGTYWYRNLGWSARQRRGGVRSSGRDRLVITGLLVGVIAATAFAVVGWVTRGHDIRHAAITATLTVVDGDSPEYLPRPPFGQSEALLVRDLGETPGQRIDHIWRFKVGDTHQTCGVLYYTRTAFWRPVAGIACRDDNGVVQVAEFSGDVPGAKTSLVHQHRLADRVNDLIPGGITVAGDVYGYIEDGEPHLVAPVRTISGWPAWRHTWAATVIFDRTGTATVHRTLDGTIPGPATGVSNADDVLRAVNNRGTFRQAFLGEFAYDTAGEGVNVTHYLLERADGMGERLVTMLTPRGDSRTPTAILEVSVTTIGDAGWPEATLYRLPGSRETGRSRASNDEVIATIANLYGPALQLADSGNRLLELTPLGPDTVNVTVGTDLVTLARVEFDQVERTSCILRADGTRVRCYDADTAQLGRGALPELFTDSGNDDEGGEVGGGTGGGDRELDGLSDRELIELLRQVTDELARRQG